MSTDPRWAWMDQAMMDELLRVRAMTNDPEEKLAAKAEMHRRWNAASERFQALPGWVRDQVIYSNLGKIPLTFSKVYGPGHVVLADMIVGESARMIFRAKAYCWFHGGTVEIG